MALDGIIHGHSTLFENIRYVLDLTRLYHYCGTIFRTLAIATDSVRLSANFSDYLLEMSWHSLKIAQNRRKLVSLRRTFDWA
jgi:hypothetical protein